MSSEQVEALGDSPTGSGAAPATLSRAGRDTSTKAIPLFAPVPDGFTADGCARRSGTADPPTTT